MFLNAAFKTRKTIGPTHHAISQYYHTPKSEAISSLTSRSLGQPWCLARGLLSSRADPAGLPPRCVPCGQRCAIVLLLIITSWIGALETFTTSCVSPLSNPWATDLSNGRFCVSIASGSRWSHLSYGPRASFSRSPDVPVCDFLSVCGFPASPSVGLCTCLFLCFFGSLLHAVFHLFGVCVCVRVCVRVCD